MLILIIGIVLVIGILYTFRLMIINEVELYKSSLIISPNQFHPVLKLKSQKDINDNIENNIESFLKLHYPEYEIFSDKNSQDNQVIVIVKN